ncbi:MAG: DUF1697 domain-containing protein [Acidobacteriota bacterium]|nr:DUF1697 domain-containing protein [Acidobacteriota bacterium]
MRNVALLRGINVGGRTMPMVDLRSCFVELGLRDVETVMQTGNVVFTSDEPVSSLKWLIEVGLRQNFNFSVRVQVYEMATLREIVDMSPFDNADADRHSYVVFFEDGLEQELFALTTNLDKEIDQVELGNGVLYWSVPKGSTLHSGFAKYLTTSRYRQSHTNRNIRTLRKIVG